MPTETNKYTYLVGYYELDEFWCVAEFKDTEKDKAQATFQDLCEKRPNRHVELVQKIIMNKVVEHYYPKHTVVN
jgi:hypothetical protein